MKLNLKNNLNDNSMGKSYISVKTRYNKKKCYQIILDILKNFYYLYSELISCFC